MCTLILIAIGLTVMRLVLWLAKLPAIDWLLGWLVAVHRLEPAYWSVEWLQPAGTAAYPPGAVRRTGIGGFVVSTRACPGSSVY